MATLVKSFSISGIDAYGVDIEVKTMDGQPMIAAQKAEFIQNYRTPLGQ